MASLGSGLIAGVFFIFSVAIMRALERVPGGMAAMQSINVVIINPMFLGVFMGTALLCVVLAINSVVRWQQPGAMWLLVGALLYLIGSLGITVIFNVPMNNALVAADPASRRRTKDLGELSDELDDVEPRSNHCNARGVGEFYRGTYLRAIERLTSAPKRVVANSKGRKKD